MAMTYADLQAAIAKNTSAVKAVFDAATAEVADQTTAFNSLQQKIATLQAQIGGTVPVTPVDTTPEVTALNASIANLNAILQPIQSADAAAKVEAQ